MAIFGLTGEPGSGKSLAAKYLHDLGAVVFDADKCVHELYADTDSKVYKMIVKKFPQAVKTGNICRDILAEIVFNAPAKLKQLEAIVHPAVKKQMKFWVRENKNRSGIYVAEVPLLFETKMECFFAATVVVAVKKDILIKRLCEKRGLSKEEAVKRLGLFMPIKAKISRAGYVIDNNSTKQNLNKQVRLLWKQLKEVR